MKFVAAFISCAALLSEGAIDKTFTVTTIESCPSECPKKDAEVPWDTLKSCLDTAGESEPDCKMSGTFTVVSADPETEGTCASDGSSKGLWQFPGAGLAHDGLTLTVDDAASTITFTMADQPEMICGMDIKSAGTDPTDGTCGVSDSATKIITVMGSSGTADFTIQAKDQAAVVALSNVGAAASNTGLEGSSLTATECGTTIKSYKYDVKGSFAFATPAAETDGTAPLFAGLFAVLCLTYLA